MIASALFIDSKWTGGDANRWARQPSLQLLSMQDGEASRIAGKAALIDCLARSGYGLAHEALLNRSKSTTDRKMRSGPRR